MAATDLPMELPPDEVLMDVDAFNDFIRSHGIVMRHYAAIRCPVGVIDLTSTEIAHNDHDCYNGFLLEYVGEVSVYFASNAATTQLTEYGLLDGSTVQVTFGRYYNDKPDKEVRVQLYDRFYIKETAALVPNTQYVEANPAGLDRLQYKAKVVEFVVDANQVWYAPSDYELLNVNLHWISSKRPGYNPEIDRNTIYSIRYLYEPYFYVQRLIHEVRVLNQRDFMTGDLKAVRAPYAAFISREYYQYKQQNIPEQGQEAKGNNMFVPRSGILPPR